MNTPNFAIVPVAQPLAADQPLPVGFLRVSPTEVVDLAGFLRDTLSAMADNNLHGSHSCVMQQTVAASAAIETMRSLNLCFGAYMEQLCFPNEPVSAAHQSVVAAAMAVVEAELLHPVVEAVVAAGGRL